ncbi:PREDICTED: orphan sodium- and chloride-dependent neurotransmitter transporter NTT5 [Miniopterus natalensis]|uniref:orphan sodium- and chloride-dependent neurotransmitter transporter NTT5 n=1 Tax=Miniopterus natalensis TaxID=291302 RepID=UPI0007A6EF4A|nr:PREDICTED: orphan sodium- and chloride-dependent neurotransmitter transporter NTT5 [Miniopterus natalensis]
MRSTQEGRLSLEKVESALESLSGEAQSSQSLQSSLARISSTESTVLEPFPGSKIWENKDIGNRSLMPCVSESQALEDRAAKAQAWETQAARRRSSQPKQIPHLGVEAAPFPKRKPSLKVAISEKENSEVLLIRPLWFSKIEYMMAQIGYSLRAIHLWRFPYLWLQNGGWSFFIIYIFLLFLIGIPLLFLEMAVGQRMRQGSIGAWKSLSPWVGGVGYTSFVVCFIVGAYLNVVNAWTLYYLSQAFQFSVPWEHCPLLKNSTDFDPACAQTTPSMYFWYRLTLKVSDRIEDNGPPAFSLILPLLVAWCLLGAFMINGIKYIGKVISVLLPMPHVLLVCLLIRSLQLSGAGFGLQYLTLVKGSAMYTVNTWSQAGAQVLLALGLGFGPIVSLSSYVDPSNNCLIDAFVVALANLSFMVIAIPFVFCILGSWASVITNNCTEKNAELLLKLVTLGELPPEAQSPLPTKGDSTTVFNSWLNSLPQPIKNMVLSHITECNIEKQFSKVAEGPKFAFLTFVEAMSFTSGSVFWSIIFFLMLLTLGLNVMMGIMQSILTSLQDTFSFFRKHAKLFTGFVFGFMFLCSFFFIQPSGVYYIRLLSDYWMILPIMIIVIFENIAVAWAYGARRFLEDLETLWGYPIYPIFFWLWCCLSPIALIVLFSATMIILPLKNITYVAWDSSSSKETLRQYPSWGVLSMIALSLTVILPIPMYILYYLTQRIPLKSMSLDESHIPSKSQPLRSHLRPVKEVQKKEVI